MSAPTSCLNCGAELPPRTGGSGRPPDYCGTTCRQAAYRRRRKLEPGTKHAATAADAVVRELAQDVLDEARHLSRFVARPDAPLLDPVEQAVSLSRSVETLTAALVGRARLGRVPWGRLGPALGMQPDTARRTYRAEAISRRVRNAPRTQLSGAAGPAARTLPGGLPGRPHPPLPGAGTAGEGAAHPADPGGGRAAGPGAGPSAGAREAAAGSAAGEEPAGITGVGSVPTARARSHLAPVLSRLQRASGMPLRALAERLGISSSQASRILSGERFPSWLLTERFARALGADPQVLRKVWEHEKLREDQPEGPPGAPGPGRAPDLDPAERLRVALHTLHVKAGRPTADVLAEATRHTLRPVDIAGALAGDVPHWPLLADIVQTLDGDPSYFQPLWEALARPAARPAPPVRAAAAGPPSGAERLVHVFQAYGPVLASPPTWQGGGIAAPRTRNQPPG